MSSFYHQDIEHKFHPTKEPPMFDPTTSEELNKAFEEIKSKSGISDNHMGGTCPNCGYCPHCGRGGYAAPYNPWPYWQPYRPYIWCSTNSSG